MQAKRIDANQNNIVESLRKIGCSVAITSMLGKGFPDIIVGRIGLNFMLEIKDGEKPPSQRKLTPDEQKFHEAWKGQIAVVNDLEEALKAIGLK